MLFCLLASTGQFGQRSVVMPGVSVVYIDYGGTPWTGDRLVAKLLPTHGQHKHRGNGDVHPSGFEPVIPMFKR